GATNVLLWDRDERLISSVSVFVTHDLEGLRETLASVLPGEKIQVTSAQRNLILSGVVTSALKMDAALQIAHSYLQQAATAKEKLMFKEEANQGGGADTDRKSGQVINLLSVAGAQEVMLHVKVAEVQRSIMKDLNAQWNLIHNNGAATIGGVNGGATFPPALWVPGNFYSPIFGSPNPRVPPPGGGNPVGPYVSLFQPTVPSITTQGLFGSWVGKELAAQLIIDAAAQHGQARILAEPTVTTLNGQEAQFLSGGSFPIPVPEQNGVIGIDYKDFGVKLVFQPLVLETGRINLKLNISVSQLVTTNSLVVTPLTSSSVFAVPALSERRASSTVELSDGQTIGIAGLMNENMNSAVTKFPGLGDIPILGQLFRSQSFQKGQTELVIFVTPTLAKPVMPGDVKLPTDNQVDPSNVDFYLRGRMEGTPPAPATTPAH
ncbi:MAG TPA: type II and III secretion system protein family protein, partial [Candidatus Dormibacteraeota bacterium]|nr:type II and III secretion system protein family protein [Candidatus Dormibacteraeota bacterium]